MTVAILVSLSQERLYLDERVENILSGSDLVTCYHKVATLQSTPSFIVYFALDGTLIHKLSVMLC